MSKEALMLIRTTRFGMVAFSLLVILPSKPVFAADLVIVSSQNMRTFFPKVTQKIEQLTSSKLIIQYAEALPAQENVLNGAKADVAINLKSLVQELVERNNVIRGSEQDFARSEVSVVVREGSKLSDITTAQAFRSAILGAKSVAYTDPKAGGASGLAMAQLLDRMGIRQDIDPKANLTSGGAAFLPLVVSGDAELAITQKTIALDKPGIVIVGPIPRELEGDLIYSAGQITNAPNPGGAKMLIQFLTTPEAKSALKESGLLK
jgi:molybdate transport system substrate-binding protein